MPRLDRPTFRRALLLGAATLLSSLSCGREITGPRGVALMRGFTFDARFDMPGLANGVAGEIVEFERVRVVLVNAVGDTVVDEMVDFPSGADSVAVSFDVPVATEALATGEQMQLALRFVNAVGDTVFRGGPIPVTVEPTLPGKQPPPPPQVPVTYTGRGANATSVVIAPGPTSVLAGDPFTFTAQALDGQGQPIDSTPIAWRSESVTRAVITDAGAGAGTTLASRGQVMIVAQLLTGPADTVLFDLLPRPQAIASVSGNNQTGGFFAPLPQPLVVRATATDGLPIAGFSVGFVANANSGSVSAPTVVTDANGLAQVSWTTGGGFGTQSVTVTAPGLQGSPITFTATLPNDQLLHHYPMNGTLADVVGGQDGAFVGGAQILDGALTLDGETGYVQLPGYLIPSTGSFSVSLFVRNRTSTSFWAEYVSQGELNDAFYIGHDPNGAIRAGDHWLNTGFPTPAIDGLYHHFVVTVDAAANTSRFYADGVLRGTLPQAISSQLAGSFTRLGRQHSDNLEYLDGEIDEVRIYRGAISAAQVAALHAAGATTIGRLVFAQQPTNAAVNATIAPAVTVRAEDALGRLKTDFNGPVTVALFESPAGVTLGGTLTVNAVNGIATFANLAVDVSGTGYRLEASAAGTSGAVSGTFDVSAGPAVSLAFTSEPSNAAPNAVITPAIVVTALDGSGNPATGFTGAVTLAMGTNPTGAVPGGTLTVNAVAGVATFSGITIDRPGTGFTLTASASGLTGDTSAPFDVIAGALVNLWTNAAGGNWSAGANWSLGRAPTLTDTVMIVLDGTYTVTMDVNDTVDVLLVGGGTGAQTLAVGARTLRVESALGIEAAGQVTTAAGIINGPGQVVNQGTLALVGGTVATAIVNDGTIIARGTPTISGALTTSAASVLRVLGSATGTAATLTMNIGFTNNGAIELVSENAGYNVQLLNPAITNGATGTITSLAGSGGTRAIATALTNFGVVSVPYGLTFNMASATHQNFGQINLTTGDLTISQSGTGPSFTNAATINVNARTLTFAGGAVDLTAGIVNGGSGRVITTGTATMRFRPVTVIPRVTFSAATTLPDTLFIGAGDSLRVLDGTLAPPVIMQDGLLILEGNPTVTTEFVTGDASVTRVRGIAAGGTVNATFTAPVVNAGAIELVSEGAGYGVTLTAPRIENTTDGSITSLPGAGGGRSIAAELVNDGLLTVNSALGVARLDAAHTNSGTIVLNGADLSVTQTGTAPSFTNGGTITMNGRALTVTGGLLDLLAGQLVGGTGRLITTGAPTVRFTTATVQPRVTFSAGTILPDPFTVPAGDSLRILSGTFAPPSLAVDGTLILEGTPTVTTAVTTGATSRLLVRGDAVGNAVVATFTNPLTNSAIIDLVSESAGYAATLNTPTLTNTSSGVINSLPGAGGSRTLAVALVNQGTVNLTTDLTLARLDAAHVNSGAIVLTGADLAVTQTGTAPSFTNTGTVTMNGRTVSVSNGLLDLSAGVLVGYTGRLITTGTPTVHFTTQTVQPRVTFSAGTVLPDPFVIAAGDSLRVLGGTFAPPSLTNDGLLALESTPTITTALTTGTGSLIRIRGNNAGNAVVASFTNALTNTATIDLLSEAAGYAATLNAPAFTNAASGIVNILVGAGGPRTIAAPLTNDGTLNVLQDLALARLDAAHVNSGTIVLTNADLTVTQTGTAPSFTNTGTVTMNGRTVNVSNGLLDLSAGVLAGYTGRLITTGTPTVHFTTQTVQPRVTFSAGTVLPDPFVIANGDSLRVLGGTFAPPSLTNNGLLALESTPTITTAFTTGTGSLLRVRGNAIGNAAVATFTNPVANTAAIDLVSEAAGYAVTLNAPGLVNASTGTINALVGAGGPRTLAAPLTNDGTVTVLQDLTLARLDAVHANSGTITLSGADLTITQTGTSPSFTNTGVIETNGRTVAVGGGLLDLQAGIITGFSGRLTTTGAPTVRFITATVQPRVTFSAGTVLPDPFVVPTGDSLRVLGGSFSPPTLTNNGVLALEATPTITTAFTTGNGSVLRLRGNGVGNAVTATFTNAFTNTSLIELVTENAGYAVTLVTPTLTNAATGVITALPGAGGPRTLQATVVNQGIINVQQDVGIAQASAAHVNDGTINLTGADLTVTQSGTTPSFTNLGTIATNGRTLSFGGGAVDLTSGLVSGFGGRLTTTGAPSLRFLTSTVEPRVTLSATTILPDPFVIPPGDSLRLLSGTFAPPSLTNDGVLTIEGTTTITTNYTSGGGSLLRLRGSNVGNAVTATFTNALVNSATIDLMNQDAGYAVTLAAPSLTNTATGVINALTGAGGTRTIGAALDNQGSIAVTQDLILARASAAHVNSGTITLTTADLTVTQTGTTPTFTNTGTISAGTRTVTVSGGEATFGGGQLTGYGARFVTTGATTLHFTPASIQPRVTLSATTTLPDAMTVLAGDSLRVFGGTFAPASLTNGGAFVLEGTVNMPSALVNSATGLTLVRGSAFGNAVSATLSGGITNAGTVRLTNESAGYAVALTLGTGTLTNQAGGAVEILQAQGGTRTLTAGLFDNSGVFATTATATVNGPIAQRASLNVAATRTLTLSGLLTLHPGSTSTVAGTLTLNGGCSNLGGAFTGFTCP